jgi:hypothetical protein
MRICRITITIRIGMRRMSVHERESVESQSQSESE